MHILITHLGQAQGSRTSWEDWLGGSPTLFEVSCCAVKESYRLYRNTVPNTSRWPRKTWLSTVREENKKTFLIVYHIII